MSEGKVQFYFDKDYKIRVFDPSKFERSEEFEKACGEFVEKVGGFNEKIHSLVEVLETHASRIDQQKLRVSFTILRCSRARKIESLICF
jgi:hypothetical protein